MSCSTAENEGQFKYNDGGTERKDSSGSCLFLVICDHMFVTLFDHDLHPDCQI